MTVISDASPLVSLARIEVLQLLPAHPKSTRSLRSQRSTNGLCYGAKYVSSPKGDFFAHQEHLRRSELDSEPINWTSRAQRSDG